MSVRELVVLGTASQVPTRRRNHNGYFVRWDGDGLMFDPGEGTQRQMIHYGVTASSITDLLITHFHGDHCLGYASLVQRISLDRVPHRVRVHYPASGQVYLDRMRGASIFHDVAKLEMLPITAPGEQLRTPSWTMSAYPLDHGPECYGYRFEEPTSWNLDPQRAAARGLRGKILGELKARGRVTAPDGSTVELADVGTQRRGQSMAFVMDTRVCDNCVELARDVDVLVIESTYLHEHVDDAHKNGHLTARQAAEIARAAGVRRLVLTHISQRYRDTEPFFAEAKAIHEDCVVAEDGDVVPFPGRRASSGEAESA